MSIHVPKGGNQSLAEAGIARQQCFIGLGWSSRNHAPCEIDASAFVLTENGLVSSDGSFIFYNRRCDEVSEFLILIDNEVIPQAEDQELASSLDRQGFMLDFSKIPAHVSRVAFCLTIHEADARGQSFAVTEHVHLRLVDPETGLEALRFRVDDGFENETAIVMAEIYQRAGQWKFRAVGQGYAGGLAALAGGFGVKLQEAPSEPAQPQPEENSGATPNAESGAGFPLVKTRRGSREIIGEHAQEIRSRIKSLLPQIMAGLAAGTNEGSSRIILDKILQQVLGYSIEEIKAEQRIQGRSADYVLSPGGVDMAVIEAKRIGGPLKEKQIFQATSYAAYAGIKWAILTNIITWRLYKITTVDKIEPHLVFTIDLSAGVSAEASHFLALISRNGIVRKAPLERLWLLRRALSTESLISAILHEDVLQRIRKIVAQENGIQLDLATIKSAVERDILKLE